MSYSIDDLIERHPALFKGKPPRVASFVEAGWSELIDHALTQITAALSPPELAEIQIVQIKEKFGRVRIYLAAAPSRAMEIADQAGHASAHTCQECGKPGQTYNYGGYFATHCPEHSAKFARNNGDEPQPVETPPYMSFRIPIR